MNNRIVDEEQIDESLAAALCKSLCECFPKDEEIFSRRTYWRSIPSSRVVFDETGVRTYPDLAGKNPKY